MSITSDPQKIDDILRRGTAQVTVEESLRKKLASGKPLRIKHGVDPTTPDLHLGYYVVYRKLRDLQEMGHTIVFLIGDFTARFGDPTGKLDTREGRNKEEVRNTGKTYLKQLEGILDMEKVEVRYNSEWYDKMEVDAFVRLLGNFSVWRMVERDMFQQRKEAGKELRVAEFIYPILQGYDSVMLESDATVIGSDQLFNELQARPLQERAGQNPQDIIAMDLLVGLDGTQKMSQSLGNYIGLTDGAAEQFGKLMSLPDEVMPHYFELLTSVPLEQIEELQNDLKKGKVHPRDAKLDLAQHIVAGLHNEEKAQEARDQFIAIFQKGDEPEDVKEYTVSDDERIRDVLHESGLVDSRSQADRLIKQGAISIDGEKITDRDYSCDGIKDGALLKAGKHRFLRLRKN